MNYNTSPFYEVYRLDLDSFEKTKLEMAELSFRSNRILKENGIDTIVTLLELSEAKLFELKGFGVGCYNEIQQYFKGISNINSIDNRKKTQYEITDELCRYKNEISDNKFDFVNEKIFSKQSQAYIKFVKQGYLLLDGELIEEAINGSNEVLEIMRAINIFNENNALQVLYRDQVAKIPKNRRHENIEWMISAYTDDEEMKAFLAICKDDTVKTLEEYILFNIELIQQQKSKIINFLTWCRYDIKKEIEKFIEEIFKNERIRSVLEARAAKRTLEEIGKQHDVTRERIRQVEKKGMMSFRNLERKTRIFMKMCTDLHEYRVITVPEIEKFIGEYGGLYTYCLKTICEEIYNYNKVYESFIIEKELNVEDIQKHVLELPDIFSEKHLDVILENANREYNYPRNLMKYCIDINYKKTRIVYHKIPLTLAAMYEDILRRFYPEGIHVYDSIEITKFAQIVSEEYGIELNRSARAIEGVITRISMLCGKGRYCVKRAEYMSEGLAEQIHTYITESEMPIFLTNTIFSIFEEELLSEKISNKYFLQGILHELFGDEWIFRRDYITKDVALTSIYSSIVKYIENSKYSVSKEELYKAFPGVTEIVIGFSITDQSIINLFGSYVHGDNLKMSIQDIEYLRNIVIRFMENRDMVHCKQIYEYIMIDNPSILKNNYVNMTFGMYGLLEYYFREDYDFSRPFIAKQGVEIEKTRDVLREIIHEADRMYISEIQMHAKTNFHQICSILDYIDTFNESHLVISQNEIATFDVIGISEEYARKIENIILEEIVLTMPIAQLKCIHRFPKLNVPWTEWLIYSIINKWGVQLEVTPSASQFKQAIPFIGKLGMKNEFIMGNISIEEVGELFLADDLTDIDDLISDYIIDDLEDLDEL